MAFEVGINFRGTAGYVADGPGETYSIGETYPTTRGGVTFGWRLEAGLGNPSDADRSTAVDRRLAGAAILLNSSPRAEFRVDLPGPGTYDVRMAIGDAGAAQNNHQVELLDGATSLGVYTPGSTTAGTFRDLHGNLFDAAAWPAGHQPLQVQVAGSSLVVRIGRPGESAGGRTTIAHLGLASIGDGPDPPPSFRPWLRRPSNVLGSGVI